MTSLFGSSVTVWTCLLFLITNNTFQATLAQDQYLMESATPLAEYTGHMEYKDIFPGRAINSFRVNLTFFDETGDGNKCRMRCFVFPECKAATITNLSRGGIQQCTLTFVETMLGDLEYDALATTALFSPVPGCGEQEFVYKQGLGCISLQPHVKTWEIARSTCHRYNSELFVAEGNEQIELLFMAIERTGLFGTYPKAWVGMIDKSFFGVPAEVTSEWASLSTEWSMTAKCGVVANGPALKGRPCDKTFGYVCQRRM